jgi:FkbM family methyltransferase
MSSNISNEDQPFHHYTLQHRITAWVSLRLFDHVTYKVRHGLLKGMTRKGGLGWVPLLFTHHLASREEEFLRNLDLRDKIVYDVGAFHGLVAMFFARQAKTVICYEPNQSNRKRLMENLALNRLTNVLIRPLGAGSASKKATMAFMPLMPGGASLEEKTVAQLKSDPSTVAEEIEITTIDIDRRENELPAPHFIKIDIEGFEIEALKGARNTLLDCRPDLFLEMHGETMREKRRKVDEIVKFLNDAGYRSILHVESGTAITSTNSALAVEGHLFCQF